MRIGLAIVMMLVVFKLFMGCGKSTVKNAVPTPNPSGENQKPQEPSQPTPKEPPKDSPQPPPENPLELSYKNLSKRVFSVSCNSCHSRAQNTRQGELSLDTYRDVKDNAARIYVETIVTKRMPLHEALTQQQFDLLKSWLEAEAPETEDRSEIL